MKPHSSNRGVAKRFANAVVGVLLTAASIFSLSQVASIHEVHASNEVILQVNNYVDAPYSGQEGTAFTKIFDATGPNDTPVEFIGIWWKSDTPADTHSVVGIGVRPIHLPPYKVTKVTLEIPYNNLLPGTSYTYDIRDTDGIKYYTGNFTTPGQAPAPTDTTDNTQVGGEVTNGLTVSSSVGSNGLTVTFKVSGTPASGSDVDFTLRYGSTDNSLYGGQVQDIATRSLTATGVQTFSFTLPNDGGYLKDSQGFVVDSTNVQYELLDGEDRWYASGTFGASAANASNASGTATGGSTVTPNTSKVKVIIDPAPDLSGNLVPCDGRLEVKACTWKKLIQLINNGITWIIYMTIPIGAVLFAYAGFLFLTKGGSEEARAQAKHIFINVAIGLIVILIAVLVVKLILSSLGVGSGYSIFL